jgi:serine/threonine protein kinase/Tfp pilus assembly protein PilF
MANGHADREAAAACSVGNGITQGDGRMNARIEELFHQVADLSNEARAKYFAEHPVDDEARHEVEALLAFDPGASSFLLRDVSIAASRALPQLEGKGWRCGPYKLLELIGRGGMGAVYLGERADGEVTQRVAVKLLPPGAGDIHRERFLQERQILASLAHPNIARMLDAGHLDNGQPFLAMEYVDGKPVDVFSSGLSVHQKITLFLKVCGAVGDLHRNLVVHRDLKPSNILVTTEGEPKLLDFGIAKILDLATDSTITGMRMLTPDYASPEQVTGGKISTATDIYSLGAVLYQLLTGKLAHEFQDQSPETIAREVTTREVTRPSKWTPELKGDLEAILLKALRKDPHERYGSVEQFTEDLKAFLESRPVKARSGNIWYSTRKFLRRNRASVALAGLALVASVAGITGIIIQARTTRAQRDFALRQLSRAEVVNDLNAFVLSDAAPSGKPFTVDDLLGRAQRLVERQGGAQASRVNLLIEIGRQYTVQDEYAKARELLEQAYRLSRSVPDVSIRARASCALAQTLSRVGEPSRAELLVKEGLRTLPDDPLYTLDRIFCLERGNEVARNGGALNVAIARAESARTLLKQAPIPSELAELNTMITLASSYSAAGRFREASAAFEQAAAQLAALGRDDTQRAGTVFNNWGVMLIVAGRPLDAEKVLRHSILVSQADSTEQAVQSMPLVNYARALYGLGRLDEAADYAERGYAKAQQGGDEQAAGQALLLRTSIYRGKGDLERAARMLSEVEPRLKRTLPKGHIAFASLASERALNAQAEGDLRTALNFSNQAVTIVEALIKAGGLGGDRLPVLLTRRADVELQLNRPGDAAVDARRAVDILQKNSEPGSFSAAFGRAHLALGRALLAQQKPDQARAEFRSAAEHLDSALGPDVPDAREARSLADLDTHVQ